MKDAEESLDAQGERNAACAERLGHVIVGYERDEHVRGGLPVAQRPGLLRTIMAIEDGTADGFIVHRLDRLARELHIQEAALAQAWAVGSRVTILEASGREVLRDDPDDPHRTFLRQVLGAAAQLERGLIVARLQGGRRRKASRGGYVGGTRLHRRFGYMVDGGSYVPVEAEQAVIDRMAVLKRDASYRAVAEALNAQGVSAPASRVWYASTIRKVLVREGLAA